MNNVIVNADEVQKWNKVVVDVDEVQNFILRTKNAEYTLDFQQLLIDYGVVRVLDSDDVRINKGDIVYGHSDGKAWRVTDVFCGDYPVWAVDDEGNCRELKPEWLTHEKPDSFKQVAEDALMDSVDYCVKHDIFAIGKLECDELKKKHIAQRCEKIANKSVVKRG